MASAVTEKPPLPQGVAYGIVLGFGIVFALCMNLITYISRRFLSEGKDVGTLMTAKKTVNTGLVAAAVVSSWCYAATILNSVRLTYVYGFSSLWWFASGCTFQIVAYSILAIELKRRAPRANTILEAVRVRFGNVVHLVFFAYGVAVQVLVTANLLLGASAAFEAMSGANTVAMNYLIPVGVVVYTYLGGLKSTFLSDYLHTIVIYIILLVCMFKVMASSSLSILGSPGKLWDLLQEAQIETPCFGAKDGSYLTMTSGQGLLLAAVILVSGFGCVFGDPSYGQKAIAGKASAVVKGYFFGAACWFAIPLGLCATMAFVGIALQTKTGLPYWPVPGGITPYQLTNALVFPYAAEALMGVGGAVAVIIMVFMAVTSSFSAELIAHASIVTFDLYQPYINPKATDRELKTVSHISLVCFSLFISSFCTGLNASGLSMGWLLEFIGVIIGSQTFLITFALTSAHVSRAYEATAGPIGTILGLCAWLGTTKGMYGAVNVTTTYENWPMFAGCMTSLFVPLLMWLAWRPFIRAPYNWDDLFFMRAIQPRPEDHDYTHDDQSDLGEDYDPKDLKKAAFMAKVVTVVLFLIFLIIIPFSLYGSGYTFSRKFFLGWTIIVFLWSWCAALYIFTAPIWEARESIIRVLRGSVKKGKSATTEGHSPNSMRGTSEGVAEPEFKGGAMESVSQSVDEKPR